ncbi:hypothetical protein BGZ46_007790 [Entomortierella lignicola]|nr:hypothetical protein BGZ46_007790 [Entomortierella lignicola]
MSDTSEHKSGNSIPTQQGTSHHPAQRQQSQNETVISVTDNEKEFDDVNNESGHDSIAGAHQETNNGQWGEGPSQVDVAEAQGRFKRLERKLTRRFRKKRDAGQEDGTKASDFDLADYLTDKIPRADNAGIKPRNMGIIWENLQVLGEGVGAKHAPTVGDPVVALINLVNPWFWAKKCFSKKGQSMTKAVTKTIIHPMSGYCREGEMLLVLGRPGAGCSTLLRVLADHRKNYKSVEGDVTYGPFTADQIKKHYRGEVSYNQEDDVHYRTLTVRQTLQTALRTKTPTRRLQEHREEFVAEFLDVLTKMFGLTKQVETIVGDAFMRGISGGERKRLSIAEQMAIRSSVNMWDGSTRGLDASSALDYAKSLRVQTSENIYDLFDKVLLLYDGRCIFFGPTKEARQYFIDMGFECPPRETTSDYLTAITDPIERKVRHGFVGQTPSTPKEFEDAFKSSRFYTLAENERVEYRKEVQESYPVDEFKEATKQTKQKHVSSKSPLTVNFVNQVKILTKRQFHLILGDLVSVISRYAVNTLIAIIVGSVFLHLPKTANGAFTRGGVLFFSLLFNALISQAELPAAMLGRPILYKWASLSETFETATRNSGLILLALILYSGYMIPYQSMHGWFIWVFWINPLAYGFKALISNEMKGLGFNCDGAYLIPNGPTYNDLRYQVCTLPGAKSGNSIVDGSDYLYAGYRYQTSQMALDIVAVICFWLLFVFVNCVALECIEYGKGGYSTNIYKKGAVITQHVPVDEENVPDMSDLTIRAASSGKNDIESIDLAKGSVFAWENVDYVVPVRSGKKQLLYNIAGLVKPGTMTALMGSSGAGKTTLLDVLGQRKNTGTVTGSIEVDGEPLHRDFERTTGYCEQLDVHIPQATVRESLQFSAHLRQRADVPKEEKMAYVEEIIRILEMENIADALVGTTESGIGISVEERKRLSIGIELVAKPKLLFLDEPTSGLDAQASYNIMRFMRKLTDQGQAILCTIHQPSSQLFAFFDNLLLLAKGGRTVFFGDLGPDSSKLLNYFEKHGAPRCPRTGNPAEYILDVVNTRNSTIDWPAIWDASSEREQLLVNIKATRKDISPDHNQKDTRLEYTLNSRAQFKYVFGRMARTWWRAPEYNLGRMFMLIIFALLNGFSFYKLGSSRDDLQNRVFAIFHVSVMATLIVNLAQPRFNKERAMYYRELAGKYYGWKSFAFSIVIIEIPYTLVTITIFFFSWYWTVGFIKESGIIVYSWLILVVFCLFSVTLGHAVAAITPSAVVAALVNPFVFSSFSLFCGVMIPKSRMPKFWSSWMYWLDPYHYFIEGLVTAQLHNVKVYCKANEFAVFNPPPGQTCQTYAADFLKISTGYINNPNATSGCEYCQYSLGQDFYSSLNMKFDHHWRNLGLLCIYVAFNICVILFGVRFFKWNKR